MDCLHIQLSQIYGTNRFESDGVAFVCLHCELVLVCAHSYATGTTLQALDRPLYTLPDQLKRRYEIALVQSRRLEAIR